MKIPLKDTGKLKGSYVIKVTDSRTGEPLRTIGPVDNLIVNSLGRGYDTIVRQLGGDVTYPIEIDSASIGSGSTAPTASDTDLETSVLTGVQVASTEYPANGQVIISFFMTDSELANGTYREFGIFATGRLFARSLISPVLTKASNQNITVEYTLTFA